MNWINKTIEGAYEDTCKCLGAGCVEDTFYAHGKTVRYAFFVRFRSGEYEGLTAKVFAEDDYLLVVAVGRDFLGQLLRVLSKNGRKVILKDGINENARLCVDHRNRVWFDVRKRLPGNGDRVFCELGHGEILACRYDGSGFRTDYGYSVVSNGSTVEPVAWAWWPL